MNAPIDPSGLESYMLRTSDSQNANLTLSRYSASLHGKSFGSAPASRYTRPDNRSECRTPTVVNSEPAIEWPTRTGRSIFSASMTWKTSSARR